MLRIEIKTVKHNEQRYDTVGDYRPSPDGGYLFTVSSMNDWRMEFLVAIHELIEWALTQDRCITEKEITAFDIKFENNRKPGDVSEPGDDPKAPYYREHQIATFVEAALAQQLRVDWNKYEARINEL